MTENKKLKEQEELIELIRYSDQSKFNWNDLDVNAMYPVAVGAERFKELYMGSFKCES